MTSPAPAVHSEPLLLFPPALATIARERLTPTSACLSGVSDDELGRLLTTIFFAGLETYEGEHHPICVTFLGMSESDFVMTEAAAEAGLPLYRWKILRFATPRPFTPRDLVKLAVAAADRRMYSAVGTLGDGTLAIVGLAREGVNVGTDPFVKVITPRPGSLSIRSGRNLVIEYERGAVLAVSDDQVLAGDGAVHRALTAIARSGGVDDNVVPQYLDAVSYLVREMIAHGRGGILIISPDEQPPVSQSTPYAMVLDSSLAALLRLASRTDNATAKNSPGSRHRSTTSRARDGNTIGTPGGAVFRQLLHSAFLTEAERVIEELGRLTAIDGAVLLNRDLALTAFGVILPVGPSIAAEEAVKGDNDRGSQVDFGAQGTRHRAAATYAATHAGSVVFVASEDGQVSCLLRADPTGPVRLARLDAEAVRRA